GRLREGQDEVGREGWQGRQGSLCGHGPGTGKVRRAAQEVGAKPKRTCAGRLHPWAIARTCSARRLDLPPTDLRAHWQSEPSRERSGPDVQGRPRPAPNPDDAGVWNQIGRDVLISCASV